MSKSMTFAFLFIACFCGTIIVVQGLQLIKVNTAPRHITHRHPLSYSNGVAPVQEQDKTMISLESLVVNLNDSQVRFKVSRRPRKIADIDREKRLRKEKEQAAAKAKADCNFQQGQEAARKAIQDVLVMHNIDRTGVLP